MPCPKWDLVTRTMCCTMKTVLLLSKFRLSVEGDQVGMNVPHPLGTRYVRWSCTELFYAITPYLVPLLIAVLLSLQLHTFFTLVDLVSLWKRIILALTIEELL